MHLVFRVYHAYAEITDFPCYCICIPNVDIIFYRSNYCFLYNLPIHHYVFKNFKTAFILLLYHISRIFISLKNVKCS